MQLAEALFQASSDRIGGLQSGGLGGALAACLPAVYERPDVRISVFTCLI